MTACTPTAEAFRHVYEPEHDSYQIRTGKSTKMKGVTYYETLNCGNADVIGKEVSNASVEWE